jgi:hypothetical protein
VLQVIVVAAMLFIVAAILFPVFAQAKTSGKPTCLSNLKGASLGESIYAEDWNGLLTPAATWADSCAPYARAGSFRCLELRSTNIDEYGHAFRRILGGCHLAWVAQSGSTPLIFDSKDHRGMRTAASNFWRPGGTPVNGPASRLPTAMSRT